MNKKHFIGSDRIKKQLNGQIFMMNSNSMRQDSVSQADLNDIFLSRELQFASILKISLYTRLKEYVYIYMAKVHASAGIPSLVGYIYMIVLSIDSMVPNFLIDAKDLWPRDSILTDILLILSYLWSGTPNNGGETRITMSLVILLIYICAIIGLVIRATVYQKYKRINGVETMMVVIIYKFILPAMIPHLMAGIPISYYTLIVKRDIGINIVVAIFGPIILIYFLKLFHQIFVPRVIFEDSPIHEWIPITATASIINAGILSMVSTFPAFINGHARMGASLYMGFESLILGTLVFNVTPTPKRNTSVLTAIYGFVAAYSSFFMTFQIALKPIKPEIFILSLICVFILISILSFYKSKKKVMRLLCFVDQCYEAQDWETERNLMDKEFSGPFSFVGKVRTVVEFWHPYLLTWKYFTYALERWPGNFNVLLLYGRLLSFFPNNNEKMVWVSSLIAKLDNCSSRTSYLLQFKHIARTRQTILSISLKKDIDQLKSKVDILMALLRRYWENILQKNVSSMWEDSEKISRMINDLDSLFVQLIDDYPNNPHALEIYLDFAKKVRHNSIKIREIGEQLDIIKKYGKIRLDLPMTIAIRVYPNIQKYTTEIMESARIENLSEILAEAPLEEEEDEENVQLNFAIQDIINRSKLGQIWIGCIVIVAMTCLSIGLFIFFNNSYEKLFLKKQKVSLNFISVISSVEYEISNLRLLLATYPLFKHSRSPFNDINQLMNIVAPNLYTKLQILPQWIVSDETIQSHISMSKDNLSKVFKVLTDLDQNNVLIQSISNLLIRDNIVDSKNFNLVISQMILDAMTMISATFITPHDFYNTFEYKRFSNYFYSQLDPVKKSLKYSLDYAESDYDSNFEILNLIMVIVVMTTLILVTLPFILNLFKLQIQSNAIADSFTLFPNTEIRRVINTFGSALSKHEDDITHVAQLSRGNSNKAVENIKLTITFAISFVPMTACCLVIYYESQSFRFTTEENAEMMYKLITPFSQYIDVMSLMIQVYDIDQDTTSYDSHLRDKILNLSYYTMRDAVRNMNNAVWGLNSSSSKYFEQGGAKVYLFSKELPLVQNIIPCYRSAFEKIVTYDVPQATDIISMYIRKMLAGTEKKFKPNDETFLNLLFYFTNFSITERNRIYFHIIENVVFDFINKYEIIAYGNMIAEITLQVAAAIFLMLYMWNRHMIIRNSLRFYFFILPDVILHNHSVMNLIESAKTSQDEIKSDLTNAELVLAKIDQCVIILDRNICVTDYNSAFESTFMLDEDKNYNGELFNKIVDPGDQDRSLIEFIQNIKEALNGKYSTQFSKNIFVKTHTGKKIYFLASAICMTAHREAVEGDSKEIDRIAIILEDCTEIHLRFEMLEQEQNKIKKMLINVVPEPIVNDFENGEERISFVVQNITIGQIRVKSSKKWDYQTQEPFEFYSTVFEELDKIILKYDLLCKVRTFGNTYIYAGGLFTQINKPEKHADQAVRFAIQILNEKKEMSKKFGVEIEMTVGVHTGGPIVAGVMNIKRPSFQIIGSVMELAEQMKTTGIEGQVQITRSVYELIFSSGFKVTERGETKVRGDNSLTTYLVLP